jgi:DNA-binding NtrC family response regulator
MSRPNGPLRILVADDEPTIADTLVLILQMKSYQAEAAYSAEQALEIAERLHPDILISDVMIGSMNGVELATQFAQRWPHCSVLLISGHGGASALLDQADKRGLKIAILAKPAHPLEILSFVAAV